MSKDDEKSQRKARMLAIYGKGGMGKSFFTTNLVGKLALLDKKVLQLGCDPKHDSCNALFGGVSLPTLGHTWRQFKEKQCEQSLQVHDIIFKTSIMDGRATVLGCEIGGPEVGRGCGGHAISFGFDLLQKFGMSQWALDFIVMDFLGDVVCGGFATPLARSLAEEVIIICGNDRQSLYAANNIARATQYFAKMGGQTRLLGLVINRDDGSGVAERFAEKIGLPVLLKIPLSSQIRDLADSFQLALHDPEFDLLFDNLAKAIILRNTPHVGQVCPLESQDFFATFGADNTAALPMGASAADLFGAKAIEPLINLQEMADYGTASLDAPTRLLVTRLFTELGLAVTTANQDPKKGLILTVQGDITICFGNDQDIESKLAVLAALHQSGQAYRYLDLRRPAAPLYR